MGLDIAFNRKAALNAGLPVVLLQNGDTQSICNALLDTDHDEDYITHLLSCSENILVPNCDWFISNDGVGENIVVRANRWGISYAPLTEWLTKHNIPWSEF